MKTTKIIIAITILFISACGTETKDDHGHEHAIEEHGHEHADGDDHHNAEHLDQEEFTVDGDSTIKQEDATAHGHDHDHDHEHKDAGTQHNH